MTPQRMAAAMRLVERSCAAQGLPPIITDPATLERVATIFRSDDTDWSTPCITPAEPLVIPPQVILNQGSPATLKAAPRLPRMKRCALYRHFDIADILIYVGVSSAPIIRGKQHAATADWTRFAVRMEAVWYASREEAEAAEIRAIRAELPVFNRQHASPDQRRREMDYVVALTAESLLAA